MRWRIRPRTTVVRASVVGASVRYCLLNRGTDAVQIVRQMMACREVCTAIMPQLMSTPTAAGMIAPRVGITLPMVAPMPQCTSGFAEGLKLFNPKKLGSDKEKS